MQLPSNLSRSTLGDLLGACHRAQKSGALVLTEPNGRTHCVYFERGLVQGVRLERAHPTLSHYVAVREDAPPKELLRQALLHSLSSQRVLGEVLSEQRLLPPEALNAALRAQLEAQLRTLEAVRQASVHFAPSLRAPQRGVCRAPLPPEVFLHGRVRARERHGARGPMASGAAWQPQRPATPAMDRERAGRERAAARLGVPLGANEATLRAAYRQRAKALHPDRHLDAGPARQAQLEQELCELNDAYSLLRRQA